MNAKEQIAEAIKNLQIAATSDSQMARHLEGMVRTDRGSFIKGLDTVEKTMDFLMSLDEVELVSHDEINKECPGAARGAAKYYRFSMPFGYVGIEKIVFLEDIEPNEDGILENIRVRNGSHGLEFILLNPPEVENAAFEGWIIIGPSNAGTVLYTWYPGRISAGTTLHKHVAKTNY